jgi:hypothetical protein
MKRLLTAAAFALIATGAQAGNTLPKDFHGSWCLQADNNTDDNDPNYTLYKRGTCDGAMVISARGFGYGSAALACRFVSTVETNHEYAFRATFKCADGDNPKQLYHSWIGLQSYTDEDTLFVRQANSTFTGSPK